MLKNTANSLEIIQKHNFNKDIFKIYKLSYIIIIHILLSHICKPMCSPISVIKFLSINTHYQTSMETCWWQREKLWYGKNEQIEEDFEDLLKRTIRSQAS